MTPTYTEKAWESNSLPVPHSEALALPITVWTSNAEAHADMYDDTKS